MTKKQIERRKAELRKMEQTADVKNEVNELATRDLINSCLCYGENYFKPVKRWIFTHQNYQLMSYAEEDAESLVGGLERVVELFDEQSIDFAKAKVIKGTYTDSEGLIYNRIVWADEMN